MQPSREFETNPETLKDERLLAAAEASYTQYFGPNWRLALKQSVLAEIRTATEAERQLKGSQPGWIATNAIVIDAENPEEQVLIKNEIVLYEQATDFAFRHELGEALWNILENMAITHAMPESDAAAPRGFAILAENHQPIEAISQFCSQLLNYWNAAYTEQPERYTGMGVDPIRGFGNIPEWKSEGFADAIAVAIKAKTGKGLSEDELQIARQLSIEAGKLIDLCMDQFITGLQISS